MKLGIEAVAGGEMSDMGMTRRAAPGRLGMTTARRRGLSVLAVLATLVGPLVISARPAPAATAAIREYPIPTPGSGAADMTKGPDGNLWFTEQSANKVARVTTGGTISEFGVTGGPTAITAGPDARLWFLEGQSSLIGTISPTGVLEEFPVPLVYPQDIVEGITAGPDGNVWYTDSVISKVGRITPTGATREFAVAGNPFGITAGPDGALWFTERSDDGRADLVSKIGRITTDGHVTEFPIASQGGDITTGPDGNLWFTEQSANKVA
ncbi:MAG: hypothetical protein LC713_00905, partial [Actinobacteria bacterium]|nr:hypothetical protein [Actinomycetota bacterium]